MPQDSARRATAGLTRGTVAAYMVAALVFAGHLAFGANRTNLALGFSALWLVAAPMLLLAAGWAREALERSRFLVPAGLFVLLLLLVTLALTPFAPGGVHPVWGYVAGGPSSGSIDPYATRVELLKLCALAAAFVIGALFGADDDRAKALLRALLVLGLAFSAWAFVDHVVNPDVLFGGPRPFGPARLSAAFGSGNTAGALFGSLTLLGLADLLRTYQGARGGGRFDIRRFQRLAPDLVRPLLGLALAATCLVLTLSRAGLIATAGIAFLLVGAMTLSRSRENAVSAPLAATGLIIAGLIVASVALNLDALGERFTNLGQNGLERRQIFAAHWNAFLSAPWGGYGLGSFARVNGMVLDRSNFDAMNTAGAAHNLYIQWLEEAGIPATAVLGLLMAVITGQLILGAVRRHRARAWIFALIAIMGLFAVYGASDYALETPSMALFFSLMLGAGYGLAVRPAGRLAAEPVAAPMAADPAPSVRPRRPPHRHRGPSPIGA